MPLSCFSLAVNLNPSVLAGEWGRCHGNVDPDLADNSFVQGWGGGEVTCLAFGQSFPFLEATGNRLTQKFTGGGGRWICDGGSSSKLPVVAVRGGGGENNHTG